MEADDIEDGEILEDESNSSDYFQQNKITNVHNNHELTERVEIKNFESYFRSAPIIKEKSKNHHESRKNARRERSSYSSDVLKKRKRHTDDSNSIRNEKLYYEKKNKCNIEHSNNSKNEDDDDMEDEMVFVLGGSLRDVEKKTKPSKKPPLLPDPPDDVLNPLIFNEGENEDPRPYSKRTTANRREKLKKDRNLVRPVGGGGGIIKRSLRGAPPPPIRKNKPREEQNDVCLFFMQGKCQRGSECPYSHSFNQPRKLEVCKFYLQNCCTKRDKCMYMHSDFPCKHFHTPGSTCFLGKNCTFSHAKLDDMQRVALKKCSEMTMNEMDDIQRCHRDRENAMHTGPTRNEKKEPARIPSLFDIKVTIPPEFQNAEKILHDDDDDDVEENEGTGTPMPSPQSITQSYDGIEIDEKPFINTNFHKYKILFEQNDFRNETIENRPGDETYKKHKKRVKKSDDKDGEKSSKKHSEKRKKRSRKDEKTGKEKKKKRENRHREAEPDIEDIPVPKDELFRPDGFDACSEVLSKLEQKEADSLSHLPKKQQELFLRIQQHQKEADPSQDSNVDEKSEEDDLKQDVNWYSSDEEEERPTETTSPLATILRTIQSNNNVPKNEKKLETEYESTSTTSAPMQSEGDSISMVDASQLANIDLSDEVTKLLTSICMKTNTSNSKTNQQISNRLPSETNKENQRSTLSLKKPIEETNYKSDTISNTVKVSNEDVDLRYLHTNNLINTSLFVNNDYNVNKDIDLRTLPFKPVPVHDAANEIDASITSHPPMEYKLISLPFITKVNYAAMTDIAKICPNDPRFKKTTIVDSRPTATPSSPTTLTTSINSNDSRYLQSLKTANETRFDPRMSSDPRKIEPRADPRLTDIKTAAVAIAPIPKCDQRNFTESRYVSASEPKSDKEQFRDPRLTSRKNFTETSAMCAAVVTTPPKDISMKLRKEDPRLLYRRSNQNL